MIQRARAHTTQYELVQAPRNNGAGLFEIIRTNTKNHSIADLRDQEL